MTDPTAEQRAKSLIAVLCLGPYDTGQIEREIRAAEQAARAEGYRKGLEEARKIAAAQYKAHMKQYEDGAKEHLAPAWSASGIVSQISAKLDDEGSESA